MTILPDTPTECPVIITECPVANTTCPEIATECPVANTTCPEIATECPVVNTTCPEIATECPVVNTTCPEIATECPVVNTTCPENTTVCPELDTLCPVADTHCPLVPITTFCPEIPLLCYPRPTIVVRSTPISGVGIRGSKPGSTDYAATCGEQETVILVAPGVVTVGNMEYLFVRWVVDDVEQEERQTYLEVTVDGTRTAVCKYSIRGDVNLDCFVNILDMLEIRKRHGKNCGSTF